MSAFPITWKLIGRDENYTDDIVVIKMNDEDSSLDFFNEDGSETNLSGIYFSEIDDFIKVLEQAREALEA